MQSIKMNNSYCLHVLLYFVVQFLNCNTSSDNSKLGSNLQRTNKNGDLKIEKSYELVEVPNNNSLNEDDLKLSVPVWPDKVNSTTVIEGFTIFVGLSIAIVLYFTIRAIRLRRRRRYKVRKYGLLTNQEDVEMTPLGEEEEDDEDSTVFDINDHSRSRP